MDSGKCPASVSHPYSGFQRGWGSPVVLGTTGVKFPSITTIALFSNEEGFAEGVPLELAKRCAYDNTLSRL